MSAQCVSPDSAHLCYRSALSIDPRELEWDPVDLEPPSPPPLSHALAQLHSSMVSRPRVSRQDAVGRLGGSRSGRSVTAYGGLIFRLLLLLFPGQFGD